MAKPTEFYVKFDCPSHVDVKYVLKEIQRKLIESKCFMVECGSLDVLERVTFRQVTGVKKGNALPPKYIKNVSEDFDDKS